MAQSEITYGEKKSLENPAWAERRQLTTTLEMTKTASPSESPCQLLRLDAPLVVGQSPSAIALPRFALARSLLFEPSWGPFGLNGEPRKHARAALEGISPQTWAIIGTPSCHLNAQHVSAASLQRWPCLFRAELRYVSCNLRYASCAP